MSDKSPGFDLQPAPRPKARLTPEEIRSVSESAAGTGFSRSLGGTATLPAQPPPERLQSPFQPQRPIPSTLPVRAGVQVAEERADDALLKLKIPDALSTALKHEAIRRKVTLRFLVLEALAAAGYAFNFTDIPEDGRRLR